MSLPSPPPTSHVLDHEALLSLLLSSPPLPGPNTHPHPTLTPAAILTAASDALHTLLPLILASVQKVGESPGQRAEFSALAEALRARAAACRGLKLRLLLLCKCPGFQHWKIRLVHRSNAYRGSLAALADMRVRFDAVEESPDSRPLEKQDVRNWTVDRLAEFARRLDLHTRDRRIMLWVVRGTFTGVELVDSIMEVMDASYGGRTICVRIAKRLLDVGLIVSLRRGGGFVDGKRLYQWSRASIGHGVEVEHGDATVEPSTGDSVEEVVRRVELRIDVDMIDMQTYDFFSSTVFAKDVDVGYKFGYRVVSHPMHCLLDPFNARIQPQNLALGALKSEDDSGAWLDSDALGKLHLSSDTVDGGPPSPTVENSLAPLNVESESPLLPNTDNELSSRSLSETTLDSSATRVETGQQEAGLVGSVVVLKRFQSIARPIIIELRRPLEGADLSDDDLHVVERPRLLVKEGDNLMQDLASQLMFHSFNHIWRESPHLFPDPASAPFCPTYEVFPTGAGQGFMEAVDGLASLSDFDWVKWNEKFGGDPVIRDSMLRSAAGSYAAGYVCGVADRHMDNLVCQNSRVLFHIDFGYVLGCLPPIDSSRFAVAPDMEAVFKKLNVWEEFVETCVKAFRALRARNACVTRTAVMLYEKAGHKPHAIREFLRSKFSLNLYERDDDLAAALVRNQLKHSSKDWKNKIKNYAHESIDPVFYGLLQKGFPPAVLAMRIVDAKEQRAARRQAVAASQEAAAVSVSQSVLL